MSDNNPEESFGQPTFFMEPRHVKNGSSFGGVNLVVPSGKQWQQL